ncbi:MAG: hypothetical protein HS126_04595 [Anaerolineales bacterium]|nr:hypothetical protein [Anaerolineales bacterium]
MAQDPKKHQKAIQRKAAKRKQKLAKVKPLFQMNTRALLRQAGDWPLREVLLSKEWNKEAALVQILIARQSPLDQIAIGVFLVDLGCLGVKNAFARLISSYAEYQTQRQKILASEPFVSADLNLAAKIIQEGVAYARQFGFEPHPDSREAMLILGEANPSACLEPIPLGSSEGKPLFVAGPYDNVDRIMAKLTKAVGADGFHYLVPLDPGAEVFMDDEIFEDDESEE